MTALMSLSACQCVKARASDAERADGVRRRLDGRNDAEVARGVEGGSVDVADGGAPLLSASASDVSGQQAAAASATLTQKNVQVDGEAGAHAAVMY